MKKSPLLASKDIYSIGAAIWPKSGFFLAAKKLITNWQGLIRFQILPASNTKVLKGKSLIEIT